MTANGKGFEHPENLVETDWLARHLNDFDMRVFDCTVSAKMNPDPELAMTSPFVFESGRTRFEEGHIPGAGFIDLLKDLSDKTSKLPFMVPSARHFADALAKCGVGDDTRVILYSTAEPIWAARVWWMLRAFGFDNAAILSGGWAKWTAEGRQVSDKPCTYALGHFTTRSRADAFVGKDDVLAAVGDENVCTINALPAPVYAGTGGPVFGRKGRIVGSVSVPFGSLHDPETGAYLPADQLRRKFEAVGAGNAERIIVYCGSGVAASSDAFALVSLGYENVTVYDASMSEWGQDASLPMETD